jgi:hypothetical protein
MLIEGLRMVIVTSREREAVNESIRLAECLEDSLKRVLEKIKKTRSLLQATQAILNRDVTKFKISIFYTICVEGLEVLECYKDLPVDTPVTVAYARFFEDSSVLKSVVGKINSNLTELTEKLREINELVEKELELVKVIRD